MAAICATGLAGIASAGPIAGAIGETRPLADARLRYENVDQEPFAKEANALTLRARLGFETGKAWNTALLAEGDFNWPLVSHYNGTTTPADPRYPVVADPEAYELNRLQLTNTSMVDTTLTLGRQRINLDDQRFVGNVGWRQNEQTFDGLRVVNKHIPNLAIDVSYINRVNRVFGPKGRAGANDGRFTGDTFLVNLAWQLPIGKLTGFGYLVDIEQRPAPIRDSTQTYGLRLQGEKPLAKVKLAYVASWATQRAWQDNPLRFNNDYRMVELTATYRQYSLGAGYEALQGDGTKGFATPLATLHRFQGWADKFLATPVNGIDDLYATAGYNSKGVGPLETLGFTAAWHDYESDRLSIDYGSELDLQLVGKYKRFTGTVKYAAYDAASTTPTVRDTDKLWVQVDFTW
jgi:hypothetical protein